MDMRKITQDELNKIIDEHQKWVRGLGGQRANLSKCDISGLDMSYANLFDGIFLGANMSSVNLACTNLSNAEMGGAILKKANLSFTNLSFTDLTMADLSEAILYSTIFYCSLFDSCKLKDNRDLQRAIFKDVILDKTCSDWVTSAILLPPMACPDTGAFIGWKKCRDRCGDPVIVKLLIPEDAKRSSAVGRKCRCNKAIVLDIEGADVAYSKYDIDFVYETGKTIQVDNFEENRFIECAPGIHFFINRQEAVNYNG